MIDVTSQKIGKRFDKLTRGIPADEDSILELILNAKRGHGYAGIERYARVPGKSRVRRAEISSSSVISNEPWPE